MTARFHAPDARASGDVVRLPEDEGRHLMRVLRLGPGDAVRVFNGRGGTFDAVVAEAGRNGVSVVVGAPGPAAPEARVAITLAVAVLKGDKMDDVVRDAVMLGVAAIQPFVAARSEISRAALARAQRRERWVRIAVSSAKQCGRAVVPPIGEPCDFDGILQGVSSGTLPEPVTMLVEPGASADARPLAGAAGEMLPHATMLVGPEGGWTPQELAHGARVCRLVTLGGRTLRADAVPLVALTALYALWGEY